MAVTRELSGKQVPVGAVRTRKTKSPGNGQKYAREEVQRDRSAFPLDREEDLKMITIRFHLRPVGGASDEESGRRPRQAGFAELPDASR